MFTVTFFFQTKLLNTSFLSTPLTQRPSFIFAKEPNWFPLCPSSWGCLSSFQYTNQNMPPLCSNISPEPTSPHVPPCQPPHPRCSPGNPSPQPSGARSSRPQTLRTLLLSGNTSSTSCVHPALTLSSSSRSFFWDAAPDLPRESESCLSLFMYQCSQLY